MHCTMNNTKAQGLWCFSRYCVNMEFYGKGEWCCFAFYQIIWLSYLSLLFQYVKASEIWTNFQLCPQFSLFLADNYWIWYANFIALWAIYNIVTVMDDLIYFDWNVPQQFYPWDFQDSVSDDSFGFLIITINLRRIEGNNMIIFTTLYLGSHNPPLLYKDTLVPLHLNQKSH